MVEKVTMAIVGCGGMAGAHWEGLKKLWEAGLRDFEITATCDMVEERAAKMAEELEPMQGKRPRTYVELEELLAKEEDLLAVDICSLHRNHHTLAVPCFEAGKHVTIEKPLALTLRAGKVMLDAAEKAGTIFQVTENYRRSPQNRAIKWALSQGMIGQVRMIYWIDAHERLWHWGWRESKMDAGGGWSLDGGVHYADLMRYHVGEVKSLYAAVKAFHPFRYQEADKMEGKTPVDVEDTTIATLEFQNGALGQWTSTTAAPGLAFGQHVIYGEEGSLDFSVGLKTRGGEEQTVEQLVAQHQASLSKEERERLFPAGVTDTVATELWEFFQALRGEGKVETDGWEGFKSQAVSEALYESAALGGPVSLADVENLKAEAYQGELNRSLGL